MCVFLECGSSFRLNFSDYTRINKTLSFHDVPLGAIKRNYELICVVCARVGGQCRTITAFPWLLSPIPYTSGIHSICRITYLQLFPFHSTQHSFHFGHFSLIFCCFSAALNSCYYFLFFCFSLCVFFVSVCVRRDFLPRNPYNNSEQQPAAGVTITAATYDAFQLLCRRPKRPFQFKFIAFSIAI